MNIKFPIQYFSPAWLLRLTSTLLCAALVAIATPAHAANLGYIDAQRLIAESPQSRNEIGKLESEFVKRKKKLEAKFDKFKKEKEKLEKNSKNMKESALEKKTAQLRESQRELRREEREYNEDYRQRRAEELNKLEKLITEAVIVVAKEEKIDMVFQQAVYASPSTDLTESVLKELIKRHKP